MSTGLNLLKGSILRTLDLLVLTGAAFFVTPYLVHSFGGRLYGFWTLVGAFVGYYGFLDLGLSAASARYMSQALGKGDAQDLGRVANTAYFLFCLASLAVLAAAALSALACPFFIEESAEATLFQKLILVMGGAAALGFPSKVYTGLLTASIRYDLLASISIGRTLLHSAAVYLALREGRGATTVAIITLAVSLLQYAATGAAAKALFPGLRLSFFRFDGSKIRSMADYGWKIFVCQLGDILRLRSDTVVIAACLGAGFVTPYAVGARLVEGFGQLVRSSMGMMLPVFSQYEGRGDYAAIRGALLRATKLSTVLSGFIGLSVIFYAPVFILRWMGPGFEISARIATILCAAMIIGLPQSPGIQLLYGVSKHRSYAVLSVCEGLANVVLSILLLRRYGVYGVALGTLVETVIFKLLIQPIYVCRAAGLPVRPYLLEAILTPLFKTTVPLGLCFYLIRGLVAPDYAVLTGCVALQSALFLPAAYLLILDRGERAALWAALKDLSASSRTRAAGAT